MKAEIEALSTYRLEQADESLESAQILFDNRKFRPSVNRSYYGMFYAVLALLVIPGHQTSKHTGTIALFNREFVKTGLFDKEFSRWLQEAFDLRQEADYRELVTVSAEQAETILEHARIFVTGVKRQIANIMSKKDAA